MHTALRLRLSSIIPPDDYNFEADVEPKHAIQEAHPKLAVHAASGTLCCIRRPLGE